MKEEWRPVKGFERTHSVSSEGRVKRTKQSGSVVAGRILKPSSNRWGYRHVSLQDGPETKKTIRLHRAVAMAFIPNPQGLREVNHINGDKNDNRVENLEWCTRGKNMAHAYRTGLRRHPGGGANANAKLTWKNVEDIRRHHARGGVQIIDIAAHYGVDPNTISEVIHFKSWKASGRRD